jgi:hypothetical protein
LWLLINLFVDPLVDGLGVGEDTFGEPEGKFLLSALNAVRSMADIATNVNAEVTTDGSGKRGQRVGLSEDLTAGLDGILTGEAEAHNGAARHKGNKAREEGLSSEISVVLLKELLGGGSELGGTELVSTFLEAGNNLTNLRNQETSDKRLINAALYKSTLDTVGLNHNVGAFHILW